MSTRFEVRNLGNVGYCLGIEITQNGNHIAMNQRGYIKHLLNRFGMIDSEPLATPVDRSVNLKKNEFLNEEDARLPYREHVGALTYLTSTTRLDVIFVESYLGQFNNCYRVEHWNTAKYVLRYLKGTIDLGLIFGSDPKPVKDFIDVDWGTAEDKYSYSDYVFL